MPVLSRDKILAADDFVSFALRNEEMSLSLLQNKATFQDIKGMDAFDIVKKGLAAYGAKDLKDRMSGEKKDEFESWARFGSRGIDHDDLGRRFNDDVH